MPLYLGTIFIENRMSSAVTRDKRQAVAMVLPLRICHMRVDIRWNTYKNNINHRALFHCLLFSLLKPALDSKQS